MRRFPVPEGLVSSTTSTSSTVPAVQNTPEPITSHIGKGITPDVISFIFKTTLTIHHREDPNVIGFIKNYLECRNVAQASRAVGLTPREGALLKQRPDIHEAISKITEAAVLKYDYDAGEVVQRVKEIVNVDPGDLQKSDGTFVESLKDVSPEVRRSIKKFKAKNLYDTDPNGMKVVVGKLIEVEFWDKMKGIELLGREKDIFKETKKVEHEIGKNMSNTLLESRKRAEQAVSELKDATPVEFEVVEDESGE